MSGDSFSNDGDSESTRSSESTRVSASVTSSEGPENLKLKNGFAELGICLSDEMCTSLCRFFHEELGKPDSQHTVVNGNRRMLVVHPGRNKDVRIVNFMECVKKMMTEKGYDDVSITEIQFLLNRKLFDTDQDRHIDSLMNNIVATFMLKTGYVDDQKGTLTLMSPMEYEDLYELSPTLLKKHHITSDEWQMMLVHTITSVKNGLSHEGGSVRMFSVTEKERAIWMDVLIRCGLVSSDGTPLSEEEMSHARERNQDVVGSGVLFYSNRSHFGAGNQQNNREENEEIAEDINGRLVVYVAFDSPSEGTSKAYLQSTSLVIFVKALLDKLLLDDKSDRCEKRNAKRDSSVQNDAVKAYFNGGKSIYPVRPDGNCLCGSVWEGLQWLLCHIRDTIKREAYENCDVYKKIVNVVALGDKDGVFWLRQYALHELEKEFLNASTTKDGGIDIDTSDYQAASLPVKVMSSLVNAEKNVSTVTKVVIRDYIAKMKVDKEYGDVTLLLALQMLLRPYARISKSQLGTDGDLSEELDPESGSADPLFTIRLFHYHMPTDRENEAHYDLIMDCNWDLRGQSPEFLMLGKRMYQYVLICSRCFWNSKRFCIKETPDCGKGLFAVTTFLKGIIVTIYPIPGVAFSQSNPIDNNVCLNAEDDDGRHSYVWDGIRHSNAADVSRFIQDDATGNYVPQEEYAAMNGLAFFINSDYGEETSNCKMSAVEVWVPSENRVVKFKCVLAIRDINPLEQFIVAYNLDGRNNSEKKGKGRPKRLQSTNEYDPEDPEVDFEATKNFESGVKHVKGKRARTEPIDATFTKRRTRRSTSLCVDEALKVDQSGEPENKKRRGRGKGKKKKEESANTLSKSIKKEKTLATCKVEVAEKQKKPATCKGKVADVVSPQVLLVPPEVVPAKTELELQKAHLESVFANQVKELEAEWASKLLKEKEQHLSMLNISELKWKVDHSEAKSALELRLQTQYSLARSEMESTINGCQIEILGLQRELEPFLQDREHATMLSRFVSQDAARVTDIRVDNYRARELLRPTRQPLSQQRGQQMLRSTTDDAFLAFLATQPTEPTLLPALDPPPTQPALLPPLILPALPAPPTQPAILP